MAILQASIDLSNKSKTSDSNFALVILSSKCLGPLASAVIKGKFISVWVELDNSILAFSAASLSLCFARESFLRSTPLVLRKSSAM